MSSPTMTRMLGFAAQAGTLQTARAIATKTLPHFRFILGEFHALLWKCQHRIFTPPRQPSPHVRAKDEWFYLPPVTPLIGSGPGPGMLGQYAPDARVFET